MTDERTTPMPSPDPMGDAVGKLIGGLLMIGLALIALPLVIPFAANAMVSDIVATRTRFWIVWRWHWLANTVGIPRWARPGVATYEFWLKLGIVLLGVRFLLGDVARLGGASLVLVVLELAASILKHQVGHGRRTTPHASPNTMRGETWHAGSGTLDGLTPAAGSGNSHRDCRSRAATPYL